MVIFLRVKRFFKKSENYCQGLGKNVCLPLKTLAKFRGFIFRGPSRVTLCFPPKNGARVRFPQRRAREIAHHRNYRILRGSGSGGTQNRTPLAPKPMEGMKASKGEKRNTREESGDDDKDDGQRDLKRQKTDPQAALIEENFKLKARDAEREKELEELKARDAEREKELKARDAEREKELKELKARDAELGMPSGERSSRSSRRGMPSGKRSAKSSRRGMPSGKRSAKSSRSSRRDATTPPSVICGKQREGCGSTT